MCPAIVTRGATPVLAVGGAGGTRIPNSVYEVLVNYAGLGAPMEKAMKAPRLDTTGTLKLGVEKSLGAEGTAFLKKIGYTLSNTNGAYVSAVSFDADSRETHGMSSGGG
jgi:gamma-glutamyltranspeptidase